MGATPDPNNSPMYELPMNTQIEQQLVDDALDAYVAWREECAEVWEAYTLWASAPVASARSAYSDYCAALEREERASLAYADLILHVGTEH